MTGQTIAHYRLQEKIGAGGMGEVYRATDLKLHREVAVKVIPRGFMRDPERLARFEREAQVLASLTHGSIAAIYGIEESDGQKAIVMELVEGEDLSTRLKHGPLPLDEAIRTGVQIAEALEVAHDRGVIHRDLKPANIKLLESGRLKLLDFGLAKALEASGPAHPAGEEAATLSAANTRAGVVLGTAAYMSPEQATGAPADKRSDIWSLGVVLFEMLTGQRLFSGQTTSHVLADVIRAEIDFSRVPPNTSPELRTLLERMLERDPRRRLRDVHDARIILERLLERGTGTHSVVQPATAVVLSPRALRNRRLVPWALGALVVAALALGAVGWMRPSPPEAPPIRMAARLADGPFFRASPGPPFDVSPDGRHIAMAVGGPGGAVRLAVRRLNELDSTTLVPAENDPTQQPYNIFFSSDGAWVGYAVRNELRKVPITGGTPQTICKADRSRGASWAPDGTIVFAPSFNTGLFKVSATGGEPQPLTTLNSEAKEETHRWPQVLPGGKAVIFTSHTANGDFDQATIEAVTLDSGERRVIYKGGSYGRYLGSGHLVVLASGNLVAMPFDPVGLTVTGPAAPVVQGVGVWSTTSGAPLFASSANGVMVYAKSGNALPVHSIVWVDRSGRTEPLLEEPGTYVNPRLAPEGKRLSLTVNRNGNWDVWIYDLERRVFTRLTFDEAMESDQEWSPDGRDIIYTTQESDNQLTIHRKRADGSGPPIPLLSDVVIWPASWSPDGRTLAVIGQSATTFHDIGILRLDGDKPELSWLLNSRFHESSPAISPDGRWLAYSSNESGAFEVYVRQFPSGGARWQVSSAGGGMPRWTRNGLELVYRSSDGIMAAAVEPTADGLRTGTPKLLFKGEFAGGPTGITMPGLVFPDYDVTRDGSRFVMFPRTREVHDTDEGILTIVSNWFGDLKRATARAR